MYSGPAARLLLCIYFSLFARYHEVISCLIVETFPLFASKIGNCQRTTESRKPIGRLAPHMIAT